MSRVKSGKVTHARHKKVIKAASGYYAARSTNFKTATQAVDDASHLGAMTPQVGQPIGSGVDSTVIVKAPPSSRSTSITCSPGRPTSRSQRAQ